MSATLLEWALFTSGGRPESYGLGDAEEIPTDGPFKIYLSDAYFLYLHKHSRAVPGTQSRTAAGRSVLKQQTWRSRIPI